MIFKTLEKILSGLVFLCHDLNVSKSTYSSVFSLSFAKYSTLFKNSLHISSFFLQAQPLWVVQPSPMFTWEAGHPGEPVHAGQQSVVPSWRLHAARLRNYAPGPVHPLRQRSLVGTKRVTFFTAHIVHGWLLLHNLLSYRCNLDFVGLLAFLDS